PSCPHAGRKGQGGRPLFKSSEPPSEVYEVALATETECRESTEAVLEITPPKAHGREVGVLKKCAFESNTAKEVHEIGECRFAHPGERERPRVAVRRNEARSVGRREMFARKLDPGRHVPVPGRLLTDPGDGKVVRDGRAGARVTGDKKRAGEGAVEGVRELDVPVADEPPRVRVHLLPRAEGLECRRIGIVAGAEVRQ